MLGQGGNWIKSSASQGPAGPQGDPGPAGPAGATGPAGADAPVYTHRSDWSGGYNYLGRADLGSSEAATVWTIKRLAVTSAGAVTVTTATSVAWANRYGASYT